MSIPPLNGSLNREIVFFHQCKEWEPYFQTNPNEEMKTHSYEYHLQLQWFQICGIIMYHHLPLNRGFLDVSGCLRLHRIWAAAATSCHRTATQWIFAGPAGPRPFQ